MSEKTDQKNSNDDNDVFTSIEQGFDKVHKCGTADTSIYTVIDKPPTRDSCYMEKFDVF